MERPVAHQRLAEVAELEAQPIAFIRGTSISGALSFGTGLFQGNGFEGTRRIIDLSGDGANRDRIPATSSTRIRKVS